MARKPPRQKLNPHVLEEAAEWFVEFEGDEVALAERQAFDEWLRRSPEHLRAFLELLPIWEQGAAGRSSPGVDAESLIRRALSARGSVIPLPTRTSPQLLSASGSQRTGAARAHVRNRSYFQAAAAVVCFSLGLFAWWHLVAAPSYSTGIAEQRSVMLDDGSTVELNARSRVRIHFTERERAIDLIEGQAIFRVAKDATRPFIVRSEGASVRAVGTQFDVYRKKGKLTVTVLEGRVAVMPRPSGRRAGSSEAAPLPVLLSAGEQAIVIERRVEKPRSANLAAATAWTQRRLMFQKATLAEVVDEFNRFNSRQLRIEDPRIEEFLVSGTFSSTDPASLLKFLREQPGIRVAEADGEIRIAAIP